MELGKRDKNLKKTSLGHKKNQGGERSYYLDFLLPFYNALRGSDLSEAIG